MITLPRILITAAAALALTAGAAAADMPTSDDAIFRVSAGKVEHTVTIVKTDGSRAVPRHERQERWLSRTRAHVVVRDVKTNRLRTEITWRPGETRVYDAESNVLRISRTSAEDDTPPYGAVAGDAAIHEEYLARGITRVIGEKQVADRRALVVESVPGRWRSSESGSRTTAVVDAETHHLYETQTTLGNGQFVETIRRAVTELLPAGRSASAKLTMRKKAGAKVSRR